jgi:altronate dehydratase small subunit
MNVECFQIEKEDNVATLLQDAVDFEPIVVRGAGGGITLSTIESIRAGHKVALQPIAAGERVIKYGFPIGEATHEIRPGEWVHLHNCRSFYDAASSSLDIESGARTERHYA